MIMTGRETASPTPKVLDARGSVHVKCLEGTIYVGDADVCDYPLSARESIRLDGTVYVRGEGRFCWLSL